MNWLQFFSVGVVMAFSLGVVFQLFLVQSERYRQRKVEASRHEFCDVEPCHDCLYVAINRIWAASNQKVKV